MIAGEVAEGAPIVRITLTGQVVQHLRNWILTGDLAPGEVLHEPTLCAKLGVSRTPMREALRQLGTEGLIDIVPNLRPRVADPSLAEIMDLLEVHTLLEAHAAKLAAERITPDELRRLAALIDEMDNSHAERGEFAFFERDMAFHRAILAASRNAPLIEAHGQMNARLYRIRFLSTRFEGGRPIMDAQHRKILASLEAGDSNAAQISVEEHLAQLGRNITAIFSRLDQPTGGVAG